MKWWTLVLAGALATAWCGTTFAKPPDGKPVFLKYKCNSCHSIEAAGVVKKAVEGEGETKMKPPDLSSVGLDKKADWFVLFLSKKEKLDGELHPKKFRGTESELKTLTAWLETMKAPKKDGGKAKEDEKSKEGETKPVK